MLSFFPETFRSSARAGRSSRMEAGPARVDARQRGISEGVARTDECCGRTVALWRGIARKRRRKSCAHHLSGNSKADVSQNGSGPVQQKRSAQNSDRPSLAPGNHHALALDRRSPSIGQCALHRKTASEDKCARPLLHSRPQSGPVSILNCVRTSSATGSAGKLCQKHERHRSNRTRIAQSLIARFSFLQPWSGAKVYWNAGRQRLVGNAGTIGHF